MELWFWSDFYNIKIFEPVLIITYYTEKKVIVLVIEVIENAFNWASDNVVSFYDKRLPDYLRTRVKDRDQDIKLKFKTTLNMS